MTLFLPIGPPACGKSTLMQGLIDQGWLDPSAVVSTDNLRAVLTGNVSDQSANGTVFAIAHRVIVERLSRGLDVWYDATNLVASWRREAVQFAAIHGQPILCILFSANNDVCRLRNRLRDNPVPDNVMEDMFTFRRMIRVEDLPGTVMTDEALIYRVMVSRPMEAIR